MALRFTKNNLANLQPSSAQFAARSKRPSRQAVLAGEITSILNRPENYVAVVPSQLENVFTKYIQAKKLYQNKPSRYFEKLRVKKNSPTAKSHASQFEEAKLKFFQSISNSNNFTTVLLRLKTDPGRQRNLLTQEKKTKKFLIKNPQVLKLASAIKEAKSSYNAKVPYSIITGLNYHNNITINKIKEHMLIHGMNANEINNTIKKIRNQLIKKYNNQKNKKSTNKKVQ